MTTITELQERLDECNQHRTNYYSNHWSAYEAEAQYLEEVMEDWDEETEYDETDWRCSLEGILEDHISLIYDDWFQSEDNIFPADKEGNWKEGTSGYQWMVWALDGEVMEFHERMVGYAEENDMELPEWYKEEYMD